MTETFRHVFENTGWFKIFLVSNYIVNNVFDRELKINITYIWLYYFKDWDRNKLNMSNDHDKSKQFLYIDCFEHYSFNFASPKVFQ